MNLEDTTLFDAEDVIIRNELARLPLNQIDTWTHEHGLRKHPIVLDYYKGKGVHPCHQCSKTFTFKTNLGRHVKSSHTGTDYSCMNCHKVYRRRSNCTAHERTCSTIDLNCSICHRRCSTIQALREHVKKHEKRVKPGTSIKTSGKSKKGKLSKDEASMRVKSEKGQDSHKAQLPANSKLIHCRKCTARFNNHRELYQHRMRTHFQIGEGSSLQPCPYAPGYYPWELADGNIDINLRDAYQDNRAFILQSSRESDIQNIYNIPLRNDVTTDDIMQAYTEIFNRQQHAFRTNISFGIILRHVLTNECRYYRPFDNANVFEEPVFISKRGDLQRIRRKLSEMDIMAHLLTNRPDTKWQAELITNARIIVFTTKFLLGSSQEELPDYVIKNNSIYGLMRNKKSGKPYDDNLCAFRCLALHYGKQQTNFVTSTRQYLHQWNQYKTTEGYNITAGKFPGINISDLPDFENCFKVNVNVYQLTSRDNASLVYRSLGDYSDTMYLNMSGNHLSYITDFAQYAKVFKCHTCNKMFQKPQTMLRHQRICTGQTKYRFPGGFLQPPKTIFQKLQEINIDVPQSDRYFPYFIVYDFESMLKPTQEKTTANLTWVEEHKVISVAICSNIPEHTEPHCIVDANPDSLIQQMVECMEYIASEAQELAMTKWGWVLEAIQKQINKFQDKKDGLEEGDDDESQDESHTKPLHRLYGQMLGYMNQVPVLGFNSAKYDLNLVKKTLAKHLNMHENKDSFVVKRNNAYTCISTETLKFIDITQFLAPGTSYAQFLKAYGVEQSKGYFPYSFLKSEEDLDFRFLPSHTEFYNELKGTNISEAEYAFCESVWKEKGMTSFKDFLVWYNILDVVPFVTAVERLQAFFFQHDIDIFKNAVSVPGIARQMLFRSAAQKGATFALFDEANKDLFHTFHQTIIGGPSIVFNRYHKRGETYIRNNKDKPCRRIIGMDANSLYLESIKKDTLVGPFVRRKAENGFRPEKRDRFLKMYHWLGYLNHTGQAQIEHRLNNRSEIKIGRYPVDGFDPYTQIVYSFLGCYFHSHDCRLTRNIKNKQWLQQKEAKYNKTLEISAYIRKQGYHLVEMWECEFQEYCRINPDIYKYIRSTQPTFLQKHPWKVSETTILKGVRSGELFGAVQVDIKVPTSFDAEFKSMTDLSPYDYFSEMSPLFCTVDIPFEALGKHTQEYIERNNLSKNPRRQLVGGMRAEQMLLATPLLKWYLDHGMKVTKIYQVVEYQRQACFRDFVHEVTEARRAGDENPDKIIIGDTWKLIGNSSFGSTIMDKMRYTKVEYVQGKKDIALKVNNPRFRSMTELDETECLFEVEMGKHQINLDLPIQLGWMILMYGKLRMLEFYYDFMDKYIDRSDFCYLSMDTDSAYCAISADSLSDVVKPEMKQKFTQGLQGFCHQLDIEADADYHWFPCTCCKQHAKRDKRTPGLFKLEYEGDEMISLCSKSYIVSRSRVITTPRACIAAQRILRRIKKLRPKRLKVRHRTIREHKFSAKGVNKRLVKQPLKSFRHVLKTSKTVTSTNRGFRARNNTIFTYTQQKAGFTYLYCKRKLLDDGINTLPLDITLCPIPKTKTVPGEIPCDPEVNSNDTPAHETHDITDRELILMLANCFEDESVDV